MTKTGAKSKRVLEARLRDGRVGGLNKCSTCSTKFGTRMEFEDHRNACKGRGDAAKMKNMQQIGEEQPIGVEEKKTKGKKPKQQKGDGKNQKKAKKSKKEAKKYKKVSFLLFRLLSIGFLLHPNWLLLPNLGHIFLFGSITTTFASIPMIFKFHSCSKFG
ncbi:hypothetical protein M5689_015121 [Euphorbia peplus]|nr:hypothetical protein M5689_015121 [Euphorbia peplus]